MSKKTNQKRKRRLPLVSVVLIAAAMLSMVTGGALAYLSHSTEPVINTFTADSPINPSIVEAFNQVTKTDVKVSAADPVEADAEQKYAVYVRAAIVATWRKQGESDETVYGQKPVLGTDYTLILNTDDWFEKDGFYYYKKMVESDPEQEDILPQTTELIESCLPTAKKDGYVLNVEIMAQTIQALGTTDSGDIPAVTDAWGVYVDAKNQNKLTADPPTP